MSDSHTDSLDTELQDARGEIDRVDRELLHLLKERMQAVKRVAATKHDSSTSSIRDEVREANLSQAWANEAQEIGLSPYFTGRILREILTYSRRSQEPTLHDSPTPSAGRRIGFMGVTACYGDLAITKLTQARGQDGVERVSYDTFGAVFDALKAGRVDYALVPVENSLTGSIGEVNRLLMTSDVVVVVDEEVWDLEHCLAGLPGASIDALHEVRSHPVALQQCQRWLERLRHANAIAHSDTARAAQSVRDDGDPGIAAICSAEAAARHGLEILSREVSDRPDNQTRFLLLARQPDHARPALPLKTSLVFAADHRCGALVDCLRVFADHGVNLTRLESRPQPEAPWEYLFLVDLDGDVETASVRAALDDLGRHTNYVRVLGSYPSRTTESRPVTPPVPTPKATQLHATLRTPATAKSEPTQVKVRGVAIGGDRFTLMLGPCAVESDAQIRSAAAMAKAHGAHILRGGSFKPRSSPHSFQGLGFEGLDLLVQAGREYELPVVTEVLQPEHVERIAEQADMLQVGARNMQNFALLKELGKTRRPVLLKRGMSATLKELLLAAEYIMAGGNQQVVLCERGIRTFETATRNTLDIGAVPVLKQQTHLPVIVDPSHAAGIRNLVVPLALAAAAAGADGVIVECHPRPDEALCDKEQALVEEDLDRLRDGLVPILASQGRTL